MAIVVRKAHLRMIRTKKNGIKRVKVKRARYRRIA